MRDDEQIAKEAVEWFVSLDASSSAHQSSEEFSSWLLQSPDHVQAYLTVAGTWSLFECLEDGESSDELIRAARQEAGTTHFFERSATLGAWSKAIALVVAILGLVGLSRFVHDRKDSSTSIESTATHERTMELDDGSLVQLDANTVLTVSVSSTQRLINLDQGQARFTAVEDSARRFVVMTPEASIQATGASFNVQTDRGKTVVAVIDGNVNVACTRDQSECSASLHASEQATVSAAREEISKTSMNAPQPQTGSRR